MNKDDQAFLGSIKTKSWKDDPITDKQKSAIVNMATALEWDYEIPKTKGEGAKLISKMQNEINVRISATGYINPRDCIDGLGHDDWGDRDETDEPWLDWGSDFW